MLRTLVLLFASVTACSDDPPPPTADETPTTNPTPTATSTGIETPPPAPDDYIGQQMLRRASEFAAEMEAATPLFRGTLETGGNQDYQAILQSGRCFRIIGVGAPSVTDLDLFLFDPNGVQVQQDTATDNYPIVGLTQPICPEVAGAYRVQVRMFEGSGEFGVQVFQH